MRMGVNPNSGKFIESAAATGRSAALMEADAMNRAREGVRDKAIGLRAGAASFGRNMPNTAAQAYGLATAAGTSAVNNMNQTAATSLANTGSAPQWMQMGTGSVDRAGAGYGNLYATGAGVSNSRMMADAQSDAGFGQLLGLGAALAISSEESKEEKEPVNADLILEGLESIPVESWKYKSGMGDSGRHVGPYAEDVNAQFGEGAAPGGEMLDMVTMNGLTMAGLQALAKKVKKIEKSMGLDVAVVRRGKNMRNTEPRRVA
jgi:hypothetical protein